MKNNSQPSSTAFTVLQGILYKAQGAEYKNLVSDEVIDISTKILSFSEQGRKRLRQLQNRTFRMFVPVLERLTLPGITLHYVLRKRYIEDYTIQALEEGIMQVVNLGAGFDTLLYRLCKQYNNVNFIEVDHPNNSELKARSVENLGGIPDNIEFVPIDFTTQTLEEELGKCPAFKVDSPALFIAEGVLMYLTENDVERLLGSLRQMVVDADVRFIFTFVEHDRVNYGPLFKLYLKLRGEPVLWTKGNNELPYFLDDNSYSSQIVMTPSELKKRYLPQGSDDVLHDGEYIAVAACKRKQKRDLYLCH